MKIDLHNHTVFSPDSSSTVEQALEAARAGGMDGIAVTDHNSVRGSLEAEKKASGAIVVITGSEVSTSDGHLLCLGIREDVRKGMTMAETIDAVVAMGGIAVPSHPLRTGTGCGLKLLDSLDIKSIETVNGRNLRSKNRRAAHYASARGLACTGGSDSHTPSEIGRAYTLIEGEGLSAEEIVSALSSGKSSAAGDGQGYLGSGRTMMKIVSEYIRRGRRHI